jgi:hypothetical protein
MQKFGTNGEIICKPEFWVQKRQTSLLTGYKIHTKQEDFLLQRDFV